MGLAEPLPKSLVEGLASTRGAELPPGGRGVFHYARDGAVLRAGVWQRSGAIGSVILSPGRTEFIEKYGEVIGELLARGFAVGAIDWRGQGLSQRMTPDPLRDHIDSFGTYVDDFGELASGPFAALPKPWILLAHSMGANIGMLILLRWPGLFSAAAFTAPMWGILTGSVSAPVARLIAGCAGFGLASRYVPAGSGRSVLEETFEENDVTHDRRRYERTKSLVHAEPRLALGSPTLGWLRAALSACAEVARKGAPEGLKLPVLVALAAEEKLVDNVATRALARRLLAGQVTEIAGARHEILMELDAARQAFWREFDAMVAARVRGLV